MRGDKVKISFKSEQSLKESLSQSQLEDGVTIREFSSVAVAASRYSISVEGNLNEDELAAIQRLVDAIRPTAQSFIAQGELELENATEALTGSLGVFEKIKLKFESVIKATFSAKAFSSDTPVNAIDSDDADSASASPKPIDTNEILNLSYTEKIKLKQESEIKATFSSKALSSDTPVNAIDSDNADSASTSPKPIDTDNIRNLTELIFSAVEAEFESQAAQLPKGEAILQSLNDVIYLLQEQLGQLLNPLKENEEPIPASLPQALLTDFSPPEEGLA